MATHFSGPVVSTSGFTGDLTGDVTGDITGDVVGDVTGQTIIAVTDYSGDDAISPAVGVASLSKGSAAAATLAAPGAANVGKRLFVYAATAQAHVITITGLTTNNTLTFGGAIGDCVELYAASATLWVAMNYLNVTPSAV